LRRGDFVEGDQRVADARGGAHERDVAIRQVRQVAQNLVDDDRAHAVFDQGDRGLLVRRELADHVEQVPEVAFAIELALSLGERIDVARLAHEHVRAAQHRVPGRLADGFDHRHGDHPADHADR
jgi:hypothetical protein